ncbi:conserved hypothetical protein, partial [Ricinus communis]
IDLHRFRAVRQRIAAKVRRAAVDGPQAALAVQVDGVDVDKGGRIVRARLPVVPAGVRIGLRLAGLVQQCQGRSFGTGPARAADEHAAGVGGNSVPDHAVALRGDVQFGRASGQCRAHHHCGDQCAFHACSLRGSMASG